MKYEFSQDLDKIDKTSNVWMQKFGVLCCFYLSHSFWFNLHFNWKDHGGAALMYSDTYDEEAKYCYNAKRTVFKSDVAVISNPVWLVFRPTDRVAFQKTPVAECVPTLSVFVRVAELIPKCAVVFLFFLCRLI